MLLEILTQRLTQSGRRKTVRRILLLSSLFAVIILIYFVGFAQEGLWWIGAGGAAIVCLVCLMYTENVNSMFPMPDYPKDATLYRIDTCDEPHYLLYCSQMEPVYLNSSPRLLCQALEDKRLGLLAKIVGQIGSTHADIGRVISQESLEDVPSCTIRLCEVAYEHINETLKSWLRGIPAGAPADYWTRYWTSQIRAEAARNPQDIFKKDTELYWLAKAFFDQTGYQVKRLSCQPRWWRAAESTPASPEVKPEPAPAG